jgi:hypothetical protein
VLDAYAVQANVSSPGSECVYAVVGDDHQLRPEADLSSELACTGPEADHLGPLPRRVVAKTLADGSRGAACEGWVGVRFDLELELAPGGARSSRSSSSSVRSSLGVPSRLRSRPARISTAVR